MAAAVALPVRSRSRFVTTWLSNEQEEQAVEVGEARQKSAAGRGLRNQHGLDADDAEGTRVHVAGARGEIAAAQVLGIRYERRVDVFKERADLGEKTEVRTRSKDYYELMVRKDDHLFRWYVLVTSAGVGEELRVWGWRMGYACQQEKWLARHGGRSEAYFVPHGDLLSVATFPVHLA